MYGIKQLSVWGPRYTIEGILHVPYRNSEVRDEFKAWFDETHERSRIDYNNGVVKTYQFGKSGEHFKIYPTQDKDGNQKAQCLRQHLTELNTIQPALPTTDKFEYLGMQLSQ